MKSEYHDAEFERPDNGGYLDVCFPTPALSLGERETFLTVLKEPHLIGLPKDWLQCSLSPGERVGVRGNTVTELLEFPNR